MRMEQGIKSFALVGAIGACVFATVPLWFGFFGESTFVTIVDVLAQTLLLIGMAGIYTGNSEKLGKLGLVTTLLMMIGFVFMVFMKMASGFFKPILNEYAPEAVAGNMVPSPLGEIIGITMIFFPLSTVLFGLSVLLSKLPRRKTLGIALMVGPFGFLLPFGIYVTPIVFAVAYFTLTTYVWGSKNDARNSQRLPDSNQRLV